MNGMTVSAAPVYQPLQLEYDGETHTYTDPIVLVEIDGKIIDLGSVPGVLLDGTAMVPAKEVFEAFGAAVKRDSEKEEITIVFQDKQIILAVGEAIAYVNEKPRELEIPVKFITNTEKMEGKAMVPVSFIIGVLGYEAVWDSTNYRIKFRTNQEGEAGQTTTQVETNIAEKEKNLSTPLKDNPIIWEGNVGNLSNSQKEITRRPGDLVDIEDIIYEEESKSIIIEASGPITNVQDSVMDGKLTVDVERAKVTAFVKAMDIQKNEYIKGMKFSENEENSTLQFDLADKYLDYRMKLSADRKKIRIEFQKNTIYRIETSQDDKGDYLSIIGRSRPNLRVSRYTDPERLVVDVSNANSKIGDNSYREAEVDGQYITNIRTSQFDENTVRVVLEIKQQVNFNLEYTDHEAVIRFDQPSYTDIQYHNSDSPSITLKKKDSMNVSMIQQMDNYLYKEYILTLPGNYSSFYGQGSIQIQDGSIERVEIQTNENNQTELHIYGEQILAYDITSDEEYLYITAVPPREKYNHIVVIDPGHGGGDPGTSGNGLTEKALNLDIGLTLYRLLQEDPNIQVYSTRLDDSYPTLQDRCDLANELQADLFVSVHNNAIEYNVSSTSGTEILYKPSCASVDSPEEIKEIALVMKDALVQNLDIPSRGLREREDLYVLNHTEMSAILVEVGYVTNLEDARKLSTKAFKDQAGTAIYQGIRNILNVIAD